VGFPKYSILLLFYQLKKRIIRYCFLKRRKPAVHNKEDNSRSKNVNTFSFISFLENLGGHIAFSAELCFENPIAWFTFEGGCKPKINKLKHIFIWKKEILRLDVSMSKSLSMKVVDAIHHLMKIRSSHLFRELSSFRYIIEEVSSQVFHDNYHAFLGCFVFIFEYSIFPHTNEFNQILMIKRLH